MAYDKLISKSTALAFKKVKSLSVTAIFNLIDPQESFNFGTQEIEGAPDLVKTVQLIPFEKTNRDSEIKSTRLRFLAQSKDLPDMKTLDNVSIDGVLYKLAPGFINQNSVVILELEPL